MTNQTVTIILQARLSSKRLPAKALLPLGELPSIVLAAKRAGNTGLPVIVATSTDASDKPLLEVLQQHHIQYFAGPLNDVLGRYVDCCKAMNDTDIVVRLTGDNVFPDGALIEALIEQFLAQPCPYWLPTHPESQLPYGVIAEVMRVSALRECDANSNSREQREHVTDWLYEHYPPEKTSAISGTKPQWGALRATLDTFEDYLVLSRVFSAVTHPVHTPWQQLCELLETPVIELYQQPVQNPPSRFF